jgi:hypothetical protein
METWPHAWHFSAGMFAVKVCPQTSMLSSRVMATRRSLSHRVQAFIGPASLAGRP